MNYTRTYGSDLLGVHDIQEPIYNCLEDIHHTSDNFKFLRKTVRLPSKKTYNEVSAHPLMTAIQRYNPDRPLIFKRRMSFLLERHVVPTCNTPIHTPLGGTLQNFRFGPI